MSRIAVFERLFRLAWVVAASIAVIGCSVEVSETGDIDDDAEQVGEKGDVGCSVEVSETGDIDDDAEQVSEKDDPASADEKPSSEPPRAPVSSSPNCTIAHKERKRRHHSPDDDGDDPPPNPW